MSAKKAAKKVAKLVEKAAVAGAVGPAEAGGPGGTVMVERVRLRPWAEQPRKRFDQGKHAELVDSLRAEGQLMPLLVRAVGDGVDGVEYEVIAGERRWRAAEPAGIAVLECKVRELSDKQAIAIAMTENLQRDDLTAMEAARGYQGMVSKGWSVMEIAGMFGKHKDVIYAALDLTKLDEGTVGALEEGRITVTTARTLGRVEGEGRRAEALGKILKPSYSTQALGERDAVGMVQRDYLDPQKAARRWEEQREALLEENPGAVIVGLLESGEYLRWDSKWRLVDDRPKEHEVAVHVRGTVVPTWGELGVKLGAERHVVAKGGKGVVMVSSEAIKAGELALAGAELALAGEAMKAGNREKAEEHRKAAQGMCIFPLPGGEGRHGQSLAREKQDEARKAREVQLGEWEKGLWVALRDGFAREKARVLFGDKLPGLVVECIVDGYLFEDIQCHLRDDLGVDLVALGDASIENEDDRLADGERAWMRGVIEALGGDGLVLLLLLSTRFGGWRMRDGYLEEMGALADAVGYERPVGLVEVPESEEEDDDEEEDLDDEVELEEEEES